MINNLKIPANYQPVMPYLILKDAAGFIVFVKTVFDATELQKIMRDETTIMHAEIMLCGTNTIMLAEATNDYPPQNAGLFIFVSDATDTYKKALDNGGKAVTPLSEQPYGLSGGIEDPFGNTWWITSVI
ncbi:VOC family protein [Ferruginibacter sp. HRS2-29]|uniref:VOC family protein n=1 Tax=Ferruginibacter sp. HRS2-29 TaxID=2487334 RepID=UPI0020CC9E4B|nr:VOC family protein [Ferruginibacter sp. HRS2-29]MCP9753358.1 VOC family protein [Ferruginibacter sp. HRS2-29]